MLFRSGNTDNLRGSKNDDRERSYDAHADHRAFNHCRCVAGQNANQQRAITVFISMVLARWHQHGLECPVLLLHEQGAVQDNNVWHRRPLHREPVLPWASDTAAAAIVGEATPSPARLRGLSPRGPLYPSGPLEITHRHKPHVDSKWLSEFQSSGVNQFSTKLQIGTDFRVAAIHHDRGISGSGKLQREPTRVSRRSTSSRLRPRPRLP